MQPGGHRFEPGILHFDYLANASGVCGLVGPLKPPLGQKRVGGRPLADAGSKIFENLVVVGSKGAERAIGPCGAPALESGRWPEANNNRSLTTEYLANGSFSDHTHAVCMKLTLVAHSH